MKTNVDAINKMVAYLFTSGVKNSITGAIQARRPINSINEDIIVGSLPFTFEQLQQGYLNVNIYVPNLSVEANGVKDTEYPNYNRINAIAKMVIPLIDNYVGDGFYFTVDQFKIIEEKTSSYMNIRVLVKAKNL